MEKPWLNFGALVAVLGWAITANLTIFPRTEGYLIISGGLTVHTFENNFEGFHPNTAKPIIKEFDNAVIGAAEIQDVCAVRSLFACCRAPCYNYLTE